MTSEQEIRAVVARVIDEVAEATHEGAPAASLEIAIGADHGGFALKEKLISHLRDQGYGVRDCGTTSNEAVDYPDFAFAVARLVADGSCASGIVVDGAGIGSCMAANKVPGARQIVDAWLATPWGPGRHARRVEMIHRLERGPSEDKTGSNEE
jgi:ribose 5-phosphate isomerase B